MNATKSTHPVSKEVFRAVYDSPTSLPGRYKWVMPEGDVRWIAKPLGMEPNTTAAALWVRSNKKHE
jgi:hypothetical protein